MEVNVCIFYFYFVLNKFYEKQRKENISGDQLYFFNFFCLIF